VKNGPKLRHDILTSMSKISMLRALDAPKTLYRFHPHISRLQILPVAIVQSGAEKINTWYFIKHACLKNKPVFT